MGYEGKYEVSNFGRVKSSVAKIDGLILKQYKRPDGYMQVQLKVNQTPKNMLIHCLVDQAFNGNRFEGLEVNHRDGVKSNNQLENLERVTRIANVRHAHSSGLCGSRRGNLNNQSKMSESDVLRIKQIYEANTNNGRVKYGLAAHLAEKFCVSKSTVSGIGRSRSWTHIINDGEFE